MDKDGFNNLISKIRTSIGDEASALNSEDFLGIISTYNALYDESEKKTEEINKLKSTNEELLKTNGKLFMQIGFNDPVPSSVDERLPKEEKKLTIDEIIDEKGGIR